MTRELDEKRIGLLIRMSFFRVCVCSKDMQLPLMRRGLSRLKELAESIKAHGVQQRAPTSRQISEMRADLVDGAQWQR